MQHQVIGPDLALYAWSIAGVTLVACGVVFAHRWRTHGPVAAASPTLRVCSFVAVITLVWVVPGIAAATVAIGAWARRWITSQHRSVAE